MYSLYRIQMVSIVSLVWSLAANTTGVLLNAFQILCATLRNRLSMHAAIHYRSCVMPQVYVTHEMHSLQCKMWLLRRVATLIHHCIQDVKIHTMPILLPNYWHKAEASNFIAQVIRSVIMYRLHFFT